MSRVDPRVERKRLQREHTHATRTIAELTQQRARLLAARKGLSGRRQLAMAAQARGRKDSESPDEVDTLIAVNHAEVERADVDLSGAQVGQTNARLELERLLLDHTDVFAGDAMAAADQARALFDAIRGPYEAAKAAWEDAAAMWHPLAPAIRAHALHAALHESTGLHLPSHELGKRVGVQAFPTLAPRSAGEVFDLVGKGLVAPCPANRRAQPVYEDIEVPEVRTYTLGRPGRSTMSRGWAVVPIPFTPADGVAKKVWVVRDAAGDSESLWVAEADARRRCVALNTGRCKSEPKPKPRVYG